MLRLSIGFALLLLLITALPGCESRQEAPEQESQGVQATGAEGSGRVSVEDFSAPEAVPHLAFQEPISPDRYELPSGALATWRQYIAAKPTLILFTSNFFLTPIPENVQDEVRKLILSQPAAELIRRGSKATADPLLFSDATVSAAIETGLFSEIIYVSPYFETDDELALKRFQKLMVGNGLLTEEEAAATSSTAGVISGTVRSMPFRCTTPENLPEVSGPVLLHIDLGYFQSLYKNEIKTPVYTLIHELATSIRERNWATLAVTMSYSNQEYDLSLETRFIINDLASVFNNPLFLEDDGQPPASWNLRSQAMYLNDMFSETEARRLIAQSAVATQDDPAAHFAQAMILLQEGRSDEGFAALDRAVALDKGYALAYLQLSERGFEIGQIDTALKLLDKAAAVFPDNPFILLNKAHILILANRGRLALPLVERLKQEPWADQTILARLQEMEAAARQAPLFPSPGPAATATPAR